GSTVSRLGERYPSRVNIVAISSSLLSCLVSARIFCSIAFAPDRRASEPTVTVSALVVVSPPCLLRLLLVRLEEAQPPALGPWPSSPSNGFEDPVDLGTLVDLGPEKVRQRKPFAARDLGDTGGPVDLESGYRSGDLLASSGPAVVGSTYAAGHDLR